MLTESLPLEEEKAPENDFDRNSFESAQDNTDQVNNDINRDKEWQLNDYEAVVDVLYTRVY